MSGNIWTSVFCCQHHKDKDVSEETAGVQTRSEQDKNKRTLSMDAKGKSEAVVSQVTGAHVNAGYLSPEGINMFEQKETQSVSQSTDVESVYQSRIAGLQEKLSFAEARNKELSMHVDGLQHLLNSSLRETGNSLSIAGMGEVSLSESVSESVKQQFETVEREKEELKMRVRQANESVRDLKHEIAVLQKRLQSAENPHPLSSHSPSPRPPTPPPPPPPSQPVNPLRSLFVLIQKRKETKAKDSMEYFEEPVELRSVSSGSHTGESFSSASPQQAPGMTEMLNMIKHGVSLKHVPSFHKEHSKDEQLGSGRSLNLAGEGVEPELEGILKRRKQSTDNYISDGSLDSLDMDSMGRSSHKPVESVAITAIKRSPGKGNLGFLCRRSGEDQAEGSPVSKSAEDFDDARRASAGDEGSASTIIPVTFPLDVSDDGSPAKYTARIIQGQPEKMLPTEEKGPEVHMDDEILGAILTDLMTTLWNQDSMELQGDGVAQEDAHLDKKGTPKTIEYLPDEVLGSPSRDWQQEDDNCDTSKELETEPVIKTGSKLVVEQVAVLADDQSPTVDHEKDGFQNPNSNQVELNPQQDDQGVEKANEVDLENEPSFKIDCFSKMTAEQGAVLASEGSLNQVENERQGDDPLESYQEVRLTETYSNMKLGQSKIQNDQSLKDNEGDQNPASNQDKMEPVVAADVLVHGDSTTQSSMDEFVLDSFDSQSQPALLSPRPHAQGLCSAGSTDIRDLEQDSSEESKTENHEPPVEFQCRKQAVKNLTLVLGKGDLGPPIYSNQLQSVTLQVNNQNLISLESQDKDMVDNTISFSVDQDVPKCSPTDSQIFFC
ncbi:uncharacterized protein LOC121302251 isoform X1 [Polyodon spathula]|uniref:uncharacterized protein LOC121302251 isoform X1 n=1 Tax=Polyodon spathula TaxID=7913 RepID=UPI001B7F0EE1|nr:uncharacterized protein LOC121302251 isoform X1 [Polyodon spathula]